MFVIAFLEKNCIIDVKKIWIFLLKVIKNVYFLEMVFISMLLRSEDK